MSDAPPDDDGETVTLAVDVTESLLDEIDDTWQERGFDGRDEYVRHVLEDATEFPTFDRSDLVALLQVELDIREGVTMGATEARKRFGGEDWGDWKGTAVDPRTVRDEENDS